MIWLICATINYIRDCLWFIYSVFSVFMCEYINLNWLELIQYGYAWPFCWRPNFTLNGNLCEIEINATLESIIFSRQAYEGRIGSILFFHKVISPFSCVNWSVNSILGCIRPNFTIGIHSHPNDWLQQNEGEFDNYKISNALASIDFWIHANIQIAMRLNNVMH